jgi:hypothetical protein
MLPNSSDSLNTNPMVNLIKEEFPRDALNTNGQLTIPCDNSNRVNSTNQLNQYGAPTTNSAFMAFASPFQNIYAIRSDNIQSRFQGCHDNEFKSMHEVDPFNDSELSKYANTKLIGYNTVNQGWPLWTNNQSEWEPKTTFFECCDEISLGTIESNPFSSIYPTSITNYGTNLSSNKVTEIPQKPVRCLFI